jgi:predicted HicB family RNase H-like nuclease
MRTKMLGVRLPVALHAKLKAAAKARRLSMRAYIEQLLAAAVEKGR